VFECVINVSEGRDLALLDELSSSVSSSLRDRHSDEFHNRSVFTLVNDPDVLVDDVRSLIGAAFARLDLATHQGVHPRFGVVDVVPFVALDTDQSDVALSMRDDTARWIATTFDVPCFLYGQVKGKLRTLPEVRLGAFRSLPPDVGPDAPSPKLGAVAVGARPVLVAWNLWLSGVTLNGAKVIAATIRRPEVRALGFEVGDLVQVSCNLVEPMKVGPSFVYDQVASLVPPGGVIQRAELVGLIPAAVLDCEDPTRWAMLGLSDHQTIEYRCSLA
jgi:glutamate formiminotransferase